MTPNSIVVLNMASDGCNALSMDTKLHIMMGRALYVVLRYDYYFKGFFSWKDNIEVHIITYINLTVSCSAGIKKVESVCFLSKTEIDYILPKYADIGSSF